MINVVLDRRFLLLHAAEDSVANSIAGNVAKPAFDNAQPRSAGRSKSHVESLVTPQPVNALRFLIAPHQCPGNSFVNGGLGAESLLPSLARRGATDFFQRDEY